MPQVETLPQSIADVRTIVLKPRLDLGDLGLIGEKIKPSLFARFGFKSKPEDVRLLASETYYEPYLVIAGKYILDYCRKHVFEVNVKETTTKIFVAGQEFRSEQSDPKVTNKVVKMVGEEYAHHERQSYYVLDRMNREIPPEKLPISPFEVQKEQSKPSATFKSIQISDETQIEFLKTKIAQRPADVAEIIREIFDITDRTILYYPMYQLTYENIKNRKDTTVTINGITGETILNGTKKIAVKIIVAEDQNAKTQPEQANAYEEAQAKTILDRNPFCTTDNTKNDPEEEVVQPTQPDAEENMILGFPAKIHGKVFSVDNKKEVVVGDVEIPSGTEIDKTLVVKGSLKIGNDCRVHGKLKALKDITVGTDAIIEGDVISGGNVTLGPRSLISGSLQAAGRVIIGDQENVELGIRSRSKKAIISDIQLDVVEIEEIH